MYVILNYSQTKNTSSKWVLHNYFTKFWKIIKNVRKLKKSQIFFWRIAYFFYNHAMSNFKIRKLPKDQIIAEKKPLDSTKQTKKKLRIFVATLIVILGWFFLFNVVAQSIGKIHIGTNEVVFTPIIFQFSWATVAPEWSQNILIAWIGGQGHEGSLLTDSLMLARLDHKNKKVTLLSLPRDLFIAYPGWKSGGRINTLYGMTVWEKKWINLLAEKVSEITGQPIDHYMVIDFTGFKYIVNALEGIDIDVPKDVVDREYPDNNYGYTTFIVRRWVQTFDGETALRYARSRHSTSDFDRSERQQLIIKAIKEKALSLDFLTSPSKIQDVLTAIRSHIDTDLTVWDIVDMGKLMQDLGDESINVYSLWNSCVALNCSAWAYLYSPAREYFEWASVLIPENASANKLSYYADTSRFTDFIFRFPHIRHEKIPLVIVHNKSNYQYARNIAVSLRKLGFNFDNEWLFLESTWSLETSRINIYRNEEINLGWKMDATPIEAFKAIEEKIPYVSTSHNEFMTTDWPKIEIVLGKDSNSYFTFSKPAYYLPYVPLESTGQVLSWESLSWWTISGEQKARTPSVKGKKTTESIQNSQDEYSISPWEWENFNP